MYKRRDQLFPFEALSFLATKTAKMGSRGDYLGDLGLGTTQGLCDAGIGATLFLKRIFWDVWTFEGAFQLHFMMIKDNQVMFKQDKKK